jgi:hypothetical protein
LSAKEGCLLKHNQPSSVALQAATIWQAQLFGMVVDQWWFLNMTTPSAARIAPLSHQQKKVAH